MDKKEWRLKAENCEKVYAGKENWHLWIPISKQKSEKSEHVSVLMCQRCFHTINTAEMYEHRQPFEEDNETPENFS